MTDKCGCRHFASVQEHCLPQAGGSRRYGPQGEYTCLFLSQSICVTLTLQPIPFLQCHTYEQFVLVEGWDPREQARPYHMFQEISVD